MGNDILQRLPFWAFDYAKHAFLLGKETVPIISTPKDHNRSDPQCFVPCYVVGSSAREDVSWINHGTLLADDRILVAYGVFRPPSARLYHSNPTKSPHIIYKDQHLTTAEPVLNLPSGTCRTPGMLLAGPHQSMLCARNHYRHPTPGFNLTWTRPTLPTNSVVYYMTFSPNSKTASPLLRMILGGTITP
ncbi:unnamed protein product [Heligmosomoides polygyrus]|uniref:Uncharacterized protein n=1 Tax=Heligmosomoides polygyrus TaxID=6339 RepID=A0A3P7XQ29_HELPZ|nr:unnamed protein product [Heligmosomoides polygyrus]